MDFFVLSLFLFSMSMSAVISIFKKKKFVFFLIFFFFAFITYNFCFCKTMDIFYNSIHIKTKIDCNRICPNLIDVLNSDISPNKFKKLHFDCMQIEKSVLDNYAFLNLKDQLLFNSLGLEYFKVLPIDSYLSTTQRFVGTIYHELFLIFFVVISFYTGILFLIKVFYKEIKHYFFIKNLWFLMVCIIILYYFMFFTYY